MHRRELLRRRDIGLLVAGLGIGSGVILLLAPSNGKEIRYAIGRRWRKTRKNIRRQAQSLGDYAEDLMEQASHLQKRGQRLRERGFKLVRSFRAA